MRLFIVADKALTDSVSSYEYVISGNKLHADKTQTKCTFNTMMLRRMDGAWMWHVCMTSFIHVLCAILEEKKSRIISVVLTDPDPSLHTDCGCYLFLWASRIGWLGIGSCAQQELLNEAMAGKLLLKGGKGSTSLGVCVMAWICKLAGQR